MAAALPFMMAASAAISAIGAIQQGNAAAAQNESQANMARYNAQVSQNQAEQARQVSTAEQLAQQRKARANIGQLNASIAQSGTGFGGTNADILGQTQTLSELDQLNLAYEGQLKAQGFVTQAGIDEFQARVYQNNARNARTAGVFGVAKSLIAGASSIYGKPAGAVNYAPVSSRSFS